MADPGRDRRRGPPDPARLVGPARGHAQRLGALRRPAGLAQRDGGRRADQPRALSRRSRAMIALRSPRSSRYAMNKNATIARMAAATARPAATSFPLTGTARLTATPTAAPAAPAASPASIPWPKPSTAAGPQIRRVAITSG